MPTRSIITYITYFLFLGFGVAAKLDRRTGRRTDVHEVPRPIHLGIGVQLTEKYVGISIVFECRLARSLFQRARKHPINLFRCQPRSPQQLLSS